MGRKKGKKGRAGKYCQVCQGEEHDSCSLTPGCPCCDTTIQEMARQNVAVAAEIPPLLGLKGCGREECGASSNISEDASFGTGELDDYGFWEEGCYTCARAYESRHPEEKAWPYSKDELDRQREEEHAHWREQGTQWAREQDGPHDLFILLCSTLRYSIDRPYDGSLTTFERLIQRYGQQLTKPQRGQLIAEITEKVARATLYVEPVVFGSIEAQKGWESIAGQLAAMEDIDEMRPTAEELALMKAGRVLDAIKAVRCRTNLGLREAKNLIDTWRGKPEMYGLAE